MKLIETNTIIDKFREIISPEFEEWLQENGYYTAPAGMKHHGNYRAGLLNHSVEVTHWLIQLTNIGLFEWQREESPYIVGMLHDICKIDSYKKVNDNEYEWNKETLYTGHGDKSLMILSSHILLTDEEAACIRYHMGAFTDKEEWANYSRAVKEYPNVLFTHSADMIASQVMEV